jgi:hypothetical protein
MLGTKSERGPSLERSTHKLGSWEWMVRDQLSLEIRLSSACVR